MPKCETEWTNGDATPTGESQVQPKQRGFLTCFSRTGWALLASAALCLPAARLSAQAAEPAPTVPPAPTPAIEPKPVVGAPAAPEPTVLATAPAETPALAEPESVIPDPPPAPKLEAPMLKIGMGVRTGLAFSHLNPPGEGATTNTVSLHDGLFDLVTIRPYFSAQLTKNIGVVANFDIETSGFNILDAIAQFKIIDEFQLWVGQHIPANDRNNFCGPFFANTWNFAVTIQSYPMDFAARDRGFTFWGLVGGGILKYHVSAVDLQPGRNMKNARYAGRVTLNLLDPENYYYASGTYFGAQDTLAIGGVFSYQKGVDTTDAMGATLTDNDFIGFSFDLLFEKHTAKAGTFTLEGGYWNFDNTGDQYVVNQGTKSMGSGFVSGFGQSALAGVSWLTPKKYWLGQFQPNVKFQWADKKVNDPLKADASKVLDIGLGYIIDGYNHQWRANYRFGDTHLGKEAAFQVGVQFQI